MFFISNEYQQTIKAVEKAIPTVVAILMFKSPEQVRQKVDKTIFEQLPRDKNGLVRLGSCSGFFVSPDGYLLTNRHVVEDEEATYEVVWQHHHYPCQILARDEMTDLAILKIQSEHKEKFPFLKLGDSSKVKLGQTVIAIGNALSEFENTVSRGIISGLSRHIQTDGEEQNREFFGLIQTDAAINPGNSGGPLIDLSGEVIGVNTAVVLGVENIGFTIPINQAKVILQDVKKYGQIYRPSLGIRYLPIDEDLQKEHQLPFNYGAFIIYETLPGQKGIINGGIAEKYGLKEGDIILEINNTKIDKIHFLNAILREHRRGEIIKLTYWHKDLSEQSGIIKQVEIKLE
ncbi:MAG: S1C family serine protease [Minisyncoccia bacterium]